MLPDRVHKFGYLGSVRLALMPRSIAREQVSIDVGKPCCSGIVVRTDKVRVYLATGTACFFIATDHSLCEALTASFGIGGLGDEHGGVNSRDESVCRNNESWEEEERAEHAWQIITSMHQFHFIWISSPPHRLLVGFSCFWGGTILQLIQFWILKFLMRCVSSQIVYIIYSNLTGLSHKYLLGNNLLFRSIVRPPRITNGCQKPPKKTRFLKEFCSLFIAWKLEGKNLLVVTPEQLPFISHFPFLST